MRTRISSTEFARHLGDFLARIEHRGERFVITKNHRPVAELGPVTGVRETTLVGLWAAAGGETGRGLRGGPGTRERGRQGAGEPVGLV